MAIGATYSHTKTVGDEEEGPLWEIGDVYNLLLCPSCKKVTLTKYFYDERFDDEESELRTLFPQDDKIPLGLPDPIKKAYDAALKVKHVDANAFAVLVGRLIEMVCEDRSAAGRSLSDKLADLAGRGEIPRNLVGVADGLRNLRNVGAHAGLGELTGAEIQILSALAKALLEYVYSAPYLAGIAQKRLDELRSSPPPGAVA